MRRKVALNAADEDGLDEDDEDGHPSRGTTKKAGDNAEGNDGWGKGKNRYYGEDSPSSSENEDDDDGGNRLAEAVRLQRAAAAGMTAADYALAGGGESDEEEEEENDGGGTLGARAAVAGDPAAVVQALPRSAAAAATTSDDTASLSALLSEMRASLEAASRVAGPLLAEARSGGLATAAGLSFLEAKNMLLLQYSACLAFYTLLLAEGVPARDHPVVERLVQVRAFLEKARPIDRKLGRQVGRLLEAARAVRAGGVGAGGGVGEDVLAYGPRPDALVAAMGEEDGGDGLYRAPRSGRGGGAPGAPTDAPAPDYEAADAAAAAAAGDLGTASAAARKAARQAERDAGRERARAARSGFVRELAAEIAGAPEELRAADAGGGSTAALLRQRHRLEARAAAEEAMMTRVPLSKDERTRLAVARRAGLAGGALLDDFSADLAGLLAPGGAAGAPAPGFDGHAAAQRYGAGAVNGRPAPRSGDADTPGRVSLADRRAAFDSARAAAGAKRAQREEDEDGGGFDSDDPAYLAAAATASRKKAARGAAYAPTPAHPPLAPELPDGPRSLTREVATNRGLTPHRRKDLKNPRVKGRKRFAKAQVRRGGQVVTAKPPAGPYGGEATGIRSKVSKSTRF
jgi:U3 small nucleolar RNA-associated protein 3